MSHDSVLQSCLISITIVSEQRNGKAGTTNVGEKYVNDDVKIKREKRGEKIQKK